ncbi:MAG: hypothetical protein ACK51A_00780 [Sphingobacteriia bacterium]
MHTGYRRRARRHYRQLWSLAITAAIVMGLSFWPALWPGGWVQVIARSVAGFLVLAAFILMWAVHYHNRRRQRLLQLLGTQPHSLRRIHFELKQRRKQAGRVRLLFRVQLHLDGGLHAYYAVEERPFRQLQAYFLASYPDITPTTLKRQLDLLGPESRAEEEPGRATTQAAS